MKELNFVSELLQKMGISSTVLSEEEKEDAGVLVLMQEAIRNDTFSSQDIISKFSF